MNGVPFFTIESGFGIYFCAADCTMRQTRAVVVLGPLHWPYHESNLPDDKICGLTLIGSASDFMLFIALLGKMSGRYPQSVEFPNGDVHAKW